MAFHRDGKRVFHIFHHQDFKLACFTRADGKKCPGYDGRPGFYQVPSTFGPYAVAPFDPNKILTWVAEKSGTTSLLSILCTDIGDLGDAPKYCGSFSLSGAGGGPLLIWPAPERLINIGIGPSAAFEHHEGKLYALNNVKDMVQGEEHNRLFCFDGVMGVACKGQPYALNYPRGFKSKDLMGW